MLDEISLHELQEWQAYSELEPFDEGRADWRSAQIAWVVFEAAARYASGGKKGTSAKVKDFLPVFDKREQKQLETGKTPERMKQIALMLANTYNSPGRGRKRGRS